MHAVLALFVMTLPIGAPRSAPDAQCVDNHLTVTAQIHDYWHLSRESLAGASDMVARLYERIGVRIDWYPTVKKDVRRPGAAVGREPSRVPVAKLTVIVLTPEMAARAHIQDDVLGFAAVPEDGMGRIAYVIYDRVQRIAAGHGADEVGLLGSVMAHEVSHLLLGRGSHVGGGLMKDHWNHLDIQQVASMKLEFSESQADHIRRTIEDDSRSTTTTLARDAAATPMEACLARRPADSALEPAP
ncbi:MAG TPA: hypothetical protein VKC35_00420 [Vicinamibacterales bacterium]|nr:hypothetical protein [Vicinamibacterales bacterium]